MARKGAVCLFTVHFLSCIIVCRLDSGSSRPRDQSTVSESSRRFRAEFLEDWPHTPGAPYFDPSTPENVTGLVGHPVTLLCKVKNLQNRTVSWVRHRDIHLLTVGRYTYTSDQRFEAQHKPRSEEWALRIRSPQRRDSGQYECQISTTPPIGHPVQLNIVEPETEILGGPDLFIYAGSTINLTCIVRHTPEPPSTINWTHRGKTINFDSTRGGISLVTEKGTHSSSRLLVQSARTSDAGEYQCAPDNALMASARVHVLTGKHREINRPSASQTRARRVPYHNRQNRLLRWTKLTFPLEYLYPTQTNCLCETPAAMQGSAQWAGSFGLPALLYFTIALSWLNL